jgi:protein-S-isoprenylcysteine O-methyltransferase Ste14
MDTLLIFKILQSVAIVVFAVFISDIRKKDKSVPLIDEKFLRILKISYLIPLALYGYVLFTMSYLSVLDIIALSVTALGTLIAALAKINLAGMHTWTGYCKENTNCFFSKGIYRYMRHPLYTGIYVFALGGLVTLIPHSEWYLAATVLAALAYIMGFLALSAKRETEFLSKQLGSEFADYRQRVHPFLPIKRYVLRRN